MAPSSFDFLNGFSKGKRHTVRLVGIFFSIEIQKRNTAAQQVFVEIVIAPSAAQVASERERARSLGQAGSLAVFPLCQVVARPASMEDCLALSLAGQVAPSAGGSRAPFLFLPPDKTPLVKPPERAGKLDVGG